MSSNIIPEPQILISSIAWKIRLENFFKKNRYFIVVAFIILLFVSIILFNKTTIRTIKMLPTPAPIPDNRLLCPSGEDSCKGIKDVMANGDYIGVGLNDISKGASLYAVFDGKLMTSKMISPKGETFWVVYLLNPVEKKEAAYWFKGVEIKAKDVKKGDIIATTSAEPLNDFHGSNFIFTLIDASGSAIELKPEDFK